MKKLLIDAIINLEISLNLIKECDCMKKALIAVIITIIVGLFVMGIFTETLEFGLLAAIAVMGGFIIYFNDKKK